MLRSRIRLISIGVLLFACILFIKLYSVQIIHANDFAERADRQYQRPANAFNRGTIYFSDKDGNLISAATLKTGFILSINPKIIQAERNAEAAYAAINKITPIEYGDFMSRADKKNDSYEEIKKQVEQADGEAIAALKLKGVSLFKDKWRYYPGGELASHVLGFMGYKGDELGGRYGLERQYENVLARESDDVYVNFFAEIFSNFKKTVNTGELEGDIVTTIEPRTQAYLEDALKKISESYASEKTGAIIMDPKTGEIFAMAINPTFDPNNFGKEKNVGVFKNDMVESVYEMGSIIKPLTLAAGIDQGKVTASTTYNDTGSVTANNKTIYNFDKKAHGTISLQAALTNSFNTGFAYVVSRIGNSTFAEYLNKFGLSEKTGVDLPNEISGLLSNLKSPRDIEYITASFGQGIAMTPIEVIRAFSAVANGGKLVTPHVVKQVNYRVGLSKEIDPKPALRVIKDTTSEQVTNMMVYNVDTSYLGGKAKNEHYSVAAKTGTAQIAANGSYDEFRFLHSFIGFLPAHEPRFLVFMYTVNPRGVRFSSETLAKPFFDLSKFLISYYQVPPDR